MKKTFLAMCMVAMGFLAVSCYDDSRLWDEVESLGDRVEKLEKDLQADVENLNALQNKVNSLETSLTEAIAAGDKAVKEALEKKLTDLETKLTAAQQAGDKAIIDELLKEKETLTGALTALQDGLTGVTKSVEDLSKALAAVEATVGANYNELLKKLDEVDGKIDGKVDDMTAALAVLKKELQDAITAGDAALSVKDTELAAALAEAIAKIAVTKVETIDGKIVLTLADGSTVAVSAPLANVENTGLVTVVEVEGVKYWAVVEADGTVKNLDVVVGHPDQKIEFQINANGELEYRVNGGEWNNTGLKAATEDANSAIVTGFVEAEDYVEIVINGTKVVLPKYAADNASVEVSADEFFVMFGASKTVELTAEGIAEYYVMAKPDGWKAKFEGTALTVTAPTKAAAEIGAAEIEGEVLIHATTEAGKCVVSTINVTTGKGLTIEMVDGKIVVRNAYAQEQFNHWGESMGYNFNDYYVGILPTVELEDKKAFFDYLAENWDVPAGYAGMMHNNWEMEFPAYEEGVCEIEVVEMAVEDLYNWLAWSDEDGMDYGVEYTIWVAPVDEKGKAIADNAEFTTYSNIKVEFEASEITHNDAVLTMSLKGADKYFVGLTEDPMALYGVTLEQYMAESMPWNYMVNGYADYIELYVEDGDYTGETALKMSDFNYGEKLKFNTTYYYWVVPYQAGTVYSDYATQFAPYVGTFTTAPIVAGGEYAVTFSEEELAYTSVSVMVTPSEGTEAVYYSFYDIDTWSSLEAEADTVIVSNIIENCWSPLTDAEVLSESYLQAGSTVVLATVSVGADGKYGEVVTKAFTTLSYPTEVNEAHTAAFGEPVIEFTSISVEVTPAEGTTAYYRWMTDAALGNYSSDVELVSYIMSGTKVAATANAKVNYLAAGDTRNLVVVVVGADNKYNLYKNPYTTKTINYSEAMTVALDGKMVYDEDSMTVTATFSVTGATKLAVYAGYSGGKASFETNVLSYAVKGEYSSYVFVDVVDGKATVELDSIWGNYMVVYATAYSVENGEVTAIAKDALELTISENI